MPKADTSRRLLGSDPDGWTPAFQRWALPAGHPGSKSDPKPSEIKARRKRERQNRRANR